MSVKREVKEKITQLATAIVRPEIANDDMPLSISIQRKITSFFITSNWISVFYMKLKEMWYIKLSL